nr:hypothetical protein MACL_00003466 [Theileria orientalis]
MTGLEAIQWKLFDGVVVYYHDTEPLLIECLTGCSTKIQHVRKKKGADFCKANVPYKSYKDLEEILEKLKKELDSDSSTYCGSGQSKVSSTPKSPDTSSTDSSSTQDKSRGKDSNAKPSGGTQEVDKEKAGREKGKKEDGKSKENFGRTGTHRHPGPDPSPESPEETKEQGVTPGQTQHTGLSDNRDTHSDGKRLHTTEQQPQEENKFEKQVQGPPSETSSRSPSPQSEVDSSKSRHQVTHQEPSSGDTGKTTHGRDTHTSTDNTTQAQQPGSHKTHEHIEGSGGGGDYIPTSEALQQVSSQIEEDCDCAPIVALGTIAAAIVTGTVLGAVGNFVHKCLSLISLNTHYLSPYMDNDLYVESYVGRTD